MDLWRGNQGAALLVTAMVVVVAAGVLALVVDLGHLYLVQSELQRAADAGVMAGAQGLFPIPPGTRSPVPLVPDCARSQAVCQAVVAANQADGNSLTLPGADVVFGTWDAGSDTFVATGCVPPQQVTAVKVVVRKDQDANGPVPLFFAGLLGRAGNVELRAQALGFTGYTGYVPPGAGAAPLAIDAGKIPTDRAGETIRIHLTPGGGDGGVWHNFDNNSAGASDLRNLVNGSTPSPPLKVGDQIRLNEGVADSVLQEVEREVNQRDGNWTVLAPVISGDSHTGWAQVLGFAAFEITQVNVNGADKYLEGHTVPDYVAPGVIPGGPNFGCWAGVPKIVQ